MATHSVAQGTAVIWGEAGATGVTNTLSLDALASTKARMGASVDLGATWNMEYMVQLIVESGTAPAAGRTVELYMACCHHTDNWPGGVTGSDGAYNDGAEAAFKKQLGVPVVMLVATNSTNTVMKQQPVIWRPRGRYVAPVVVNLLGTAFRDEATATDNDSRVILVPRVQEIA